MSTPELVRLIKRAKKGDLDALHRLLVLLEVRLLRFVRRGLKTRNVEDHAGAEEVVQETLYRFHKALPSWRARKDKSGLARVLRIARNEMYTFLRKRRREARSGEEIDIEGGESPEACVMQADANAALREAIATLPEEDSQLLLGKFFEGYTIRSLAGEAGLPYQLFYRHRYQRALRRLRAQLCSRYPQFMEARRQAHE